MSFFHSPHLDIIEENAPGPFSCEKIEAVGGKVFYRVSDAGDNGIAGCKLASDARMIVRAMNGRPRARRPDGPFTSVELAPRGKYRRYEIRDVSGRAIAECSWPGHVNLMLEALNK